MNGFEQSYLINELSQGMELAIQLKDQMGPQHSPETREFLLQQIVSSYDKALSILGCAAMPAQHPRQLSPLMPSSPSSIVDNCNELSMKSKQPSLKRKSADTWTKQFKLSPENGSDAPPDDGYSWRKYGQKDILGAKHPRSYYRCTYRNVQNCWATRQVQRSNTDPTIFDVTYRGKHSCNMIRRSKSAPTSPAKQDTKNNEELRDEYQQDSEMFFMLQNAPPPPLPNNDLDLRFMDSFPAMDLSYIKNESPTTSTLNNNLYGDNIGGDIADMILAATSSTNSLTIDPSFLPYQWNFDPNFPFNDQGYFFEQK